ncbi:MAG: flavodoxin family protein [Bacillota bacterium]|nr:flavodoxin family protein [Bacillota bacterium]
MALGKKVVAVSGSPRSGNKNSKSFTEKILDLFLDGMEPEECKKVYPHKMDINYCTACLTCWFKTPGICVFNDDMKTLKTEIEEADLVVLASPVYIDGFSAPVKTVLDRCFSMLDPLIISDREGHCRHGRFNPKDQMAVLVSTCGFSEIDNFNLIRNHFAAICKNFGWKRCGEILIPAGALGFIRDIYNEKYEAVKKAGREFALNGNISTPTMRSISEEVVGADKYQEMVNPFFKKLMKSGLNED